MFFILIWKRKYIFNTFNKKKLYPIKEMHNENNVTIPSVKYSNFYYENNLKNYSEFSKRTLRLRMFKLFKGSPEDKLKSLRIAQELADKSTLPILRCGLKDMDPKIVELSASLIRKFK